MKSIRCVLATLLCAAVAGAIALQLRPVRSAIKTRILSRYIELDPCVIAPGRRFTVDFHGMTYHGDSSTLIDRQILCHGDWGLPELRFLTEAVRLSNAAEPVFVDVGANSGVYSLYMSQQAATVHSFDPYLPVLDRFRRSLAASNLTNVTVHPVGLGESDAELPFQEPPEGNLGTGSFVDGFKPNNSATGLILRVVNGDAYFASRGIGHFDVLKIDTEGFEKPVLLGLSGTLAKVRPTGTLEFSYSPGLEHAFRDKVDLVASLPADYSAFTLIEGEQGDFRLEEFDPEIGGSEPYQETVAFIPNESVAQYAPWMNRPQP